MLQASKVLRALLLGGLTVCTPLAAITHASPPPPPVKEPIRPLTAECLQGAAQRHGVHTDVLLAILMVEGGTVGKNSRGNNNGSYDIGPFQINSIHRGTLKRMGVSEEALRNNGCLNAEVAAWHIRRTLSPEVLSRVHDEDSYLRAIARYHSVTPAKNRIYADKLREAFADLYMQEAP